MGNVAKCADWRCKMINLDFTPLIRTLWDLQVEGSCEKKIKVTRVQVRMILSLQHTIKSCNYQKAGTLL